jgi:U3 small nucleolar RNA-associated protein 10
MVKECVSVLQDADLTASTDSAAVLQALLMSIPNFWGSSDLTQIIDLYLNSATSAPPSITGPTWTLVKTVTKRIPSKVLVQVVCEYWTGLTSKGEVCFCKLLIGLPCLFGLQLAAPRIFAYFTLLKRAIHVADRSVISDNLRPLTKAFLDSFQICASNDIVKEEVSILYYFAYTVLITCVGSD